MDIYRLTLIRHDHENCRNNLFRVSLIEIRKKCVFKIPLKMLNTKFICVLHTAPNVSAELVAASSVHSASNSNSAERASSAVYFFENTVRQVVRSCIAQKMFILHSYIN